MWRTSVANGTLTIFAISGVKVGMPCAASEPEEGETNAAEAPVLDGGEIGAEG